MKERLGVAQMIYLDERKVLVEIYNFTIPFPKYRSIDRHEITRILKQQI